MKEQRKINWNEAIILCLKPKSNIEVSSKEGGEFYKIFDGTLTLDQIIVLQNYLDHDLIKKTYGRYVSYQNNLQYLSELKKVREEQAQQKFYQGLLQNLCYEGSRRKFSHKNTVQAHIDNIEESIKKNNINITQYQKIALDSDKKIRYWAKFFGVINNQYTKRLSKTIQQLDLDRKEAKKKIKNTEIWFREYIAQSMIENRLKSIMWSRQNNSLTSNEKNNYGKNHKEKIYGEDSKIVVKFTSEEAAKTYYKKREDLLSQNDMTLKDYIKLDNYYRIKLWRTFYRIDQLQSFGGKSDQELKDAQENIRENLRKSEYCSQEYITSLCLLRLLNNFTFINNKRQDEESSNKESEQNIQNNNQTDNGQDNLLDKPDSHLEQDSSYFDDLVNLCNSLDESDISEPDSFDSKYSIITDQMLKVRRSEKDLSSQTQKRPNDQLSASKSDELSASKRRKNNSLNFDSQDISSIDLSFVSVTKEHTVNIINNIQ